MTREEICESLKAIIIQINETVGNRYKGINFTYVANIKPNSLRFVIKEAINALEQEPCGDTISREELLKAIDTWDKFGVDDTNSLFRLDNLSLPHYVPYMHYDDVIKCIKGMPPTKPQEPKIKKGI